MSANSLQVQINGYYATGKPARQLKLDCRIKNRTQHHLWILDSWITVSTGDGGTIAEGKLLHCQPQSPAAVATNPGEEQVAEIVIPLAGATMCFIEEKRAGGDLLLRVGARVIACAVPNMEGIRSWQPPIEYYLSTGNTSPFELKVPQSEWIKLLRNMQWSELELLELPVNQIRSIPTLTRAFQRFSDAQECFRRGDWDGTMGDCRKAFEALIKDTADTDDLKNASKAFRSLVSNEEKADAVNGTVKGFTEFLHLARHEKLPVVNIDQGDARWALHFTGAMLAYLAR